MTLSWIARFLLVWAHALAASNPFTCERLWDMSPDSTLPPGKTYEEWYGSPALACDRMDGKHSVVFCEGSNC